MSEQRRGAPAGNSNASKNKRWAQAIDKALKQFAEGEIQAGQALDVLALKLVRNALMTADASEFKYCIDEIGNRLDGKSTEHKVVDQSVTHEFGGLSEAADILRKFAGQRQADDSAGTVSH